MTGVKFFYDTEDIKVDIEQYRKLKAEVPQMYYLNNKVKFKEELNKLWIHGLLHLLGYDHKSNTKYLKMKKLENEFSYLIKKNA